MESFGQTVSRNQSAAGRSQLARARALADRGRLRQALSAYRKVLARAPENADLLMEAGVTAAQAGAHGPAFEWLERAASLAPDDICVHVNLGEAARLAERPHDAARHFRRALAIDPKDTDAAFGLGYALLLSGNAPEALPVLEAAYAASPNDPEIVNAYAGAAIDLEKFAPAIEILRRFLADNPGDKQAWCNMAFALLREERFLEADRAFARADAMGGLPAEMIARWARAKLNLKDYAPAMALADRAIGEKSREADGYFVRAAALQHTGDFDGAEKALRQSLRFDDQHGATYERLARMRRFRDSDVEAAKSIYEDQGARPSARCAAGFALGLYYDRSGAYDRAFAYLHGANRLKAREVPFDAEAHCGMVARVMEVFSSDFLARLAHAEMPADTPVFILGMPRSGTTLCEQILASYDTVFAGGERLDFQNMIAEIPDYPEFVLRAPPGWAKSKSAEILEAMHKASNGEAMITNKTPGNYLCVGLIRWFMPNARFIHCMRDYRDNAISCFEQNFQSGQSFTYDLKAFAIAYRQYRRVMAHWHEVLPGQILDIGYEDLVNEPERVSKEIVSFCGLEWSPSCLETHKVDRSITTASFWQVRQPINTGSVGKWRNYESQLSEFLRAMEGS